MPPLQQSSTADWPRVAASWQRPARWILVALALAQAAVFATVLCATLIRAPFEDRLQWLDGYERYRQGGDLLTYLFGFFQEHRLVWAKLLTAVDASMFGSSGVVFIAVGTASILGVAAMLTHELRRGLPSAGPLATLVWLAPMLILTTANAVDCSVPVYVVYPLTLLFVVATCVLMNGPAESAPPPGLQGVIAILMAAAAGLANAVGLLAWPVLLWSAWRCRAGRGWLIWIALVGGAYVAAYLHGIVLSSGGVAPPDSGLAQAVKEAAYLLAYLGLPLSRVPGLQLAGEVLGAVLLGFAILAFVRFGLLGPAITRLERIAVGLIMFSLGGAVLAAVGRSQFSAGIELPVRYTVLVTPLHFGLLALGLRWVADRPGLARRSGRLLGGGIAAGLLLLAQQVIGARSAVAVAGVMRDKIDSFYAGAHDADIERLVFQAGLAKADAIVDGLRRDHLLDR